MLLLVVPAISLSFILSSLLIISLLGTRRFVLAPDLLFRYVNFLVTRHIRPQTGHIQASPDISDLRPDISGSIVLTV
jgi:hypothetical protein